MYNQIGVGNIPPFFSYDNYQHKIAYYKNINDTNTVYYSKNLFPYIGEAFNINMYFVRPVDINNDVYSINIEQDPRLQEIVTINTIQYNKSIQEYYAMSSWASINRILFVSSRMPIKREYYPIANNNGITDETSFSYENLLSMNIICSFLFSSSDAGDYRTNIVYSSPTIETGDLIDMTNSGELRDIYVDVYWGDKQGNVFPLKLGANKQDNLRSCFIRR